MSETVLPPSFTVVDHVHVALTNMKNGDGYNFAEGVMQGLKAGIVAVANPDLSPDEVFARSGTGDHTEDPQPVYEGTEFYRGLAIGSLDAPHMFRKEEVTEGDGEI